MQIMIDSASDNAAYLRRVAKFLNEEADIRDSEDSAPPLLPIIPAPAAIDTAKVGFGPKPVAFGLDSSTGSTAAIPPQPVIVPLAPVAPAAPAASAGPAPVSAAALEFDSTGLPWDARIHQETRGKKVDGTWKLKKGLDSAIATTVIAELRVAHPLPNPASLSFVAPAAAPTPQQAPPPPVTQVAPPPPANQVPAAVPQAVPSAQVTGFRSLMQKITAATTAGKLTNVQVDAALQSVDLPPRQLVSLVQNPDKVAGVEAYIDACLAGAA